MIREQTVLAEVTGFEGNQHRQNHRKRDVFSPCLRIRKCDIIPANLIRLIIRRHYDTDPAKLD